MEIKKKYNDDNRNEMKLNCYYYSPTIITAATANFINLFLLLLGYGHRVGGHILLS